MKLSFWGAADTVTGSKYLVETGGRRILVDCGMFQGVKKLRRRNWHDLPEPPSTIDAVVVTHAHIDHTGYLPKLVKDGYDGPVYCTEATRDLLKILLPDAGYLQEEEAKYANKEGFSRHDPAKPLYTREDAKRCLANLEPLEFATPFEPADGVTCEFERVGHILGAARLELRADGRQLDFSGDVGRPKDPLMKPPRPIPDGDYLVLESTYGNRRHPDTDPKSELEDVVGRTLERGGVVVIPAFAVGRSQTMMYYLTELMKSRAVPEVPIYLNSPMAIDVTDLYLRHIEDHRLSEREVREMCSSVQFTNDVAESKRLNNLIHPAIIISASGMASGGRVLHHIKAYGPDAKNTILFAGFQAPGTRGDAMVHGADSVKIHGDYVPIRAEVGNLEALSAHADYAEIGDWLESVEEPPERVFLTHGEPAATDAMRRYLRDRFGWDCYIPDLDQTVVLD